MLQYKSILSAAVDELSHTATFVSNDTVSVWASPVTVSPSCNEQFQWYPPLSEMVCSSVGARIWLPAASQIWICATSVSPSVVRSYSHTWTWQRLFWSGPVEPTGLYGRVEVASVVLEAGAELEVVTVESVVDVGEGDALVEETLEDDALVEAALVEDAVVEAAVVEDALVLEAAADDDDVADAEVVFADVEVVETTPVDDEATDDEPDVDDADEVPDEDADELMEQAWRLALELAPGAVKETWVGLSLSQRRYTAWQVSSVVPSGSYSNTSLPTASEATLSFGLDVVSQMRTVGEDITRKELTTRNTTHSG